MTSGSVVKKTKPVGIVFPVAAFLRSYERGERRLQLFKSLLRGELEFNVKDIHCYPFFNPLNIASITCPTTARSIIPRFSDTIA